MFDILTFLTLIITIILLSNRMASSSRTTINTKRPMQIWTSIKSSLFTDRADVILLDSEEIHAVNNFSHRHPLETYILDRTNNVLLTCPGDRIGALIDINNEASQTRAISLVGCVDWLVLRCTCDWTMIPVENLISFCQNTITKLAVFVNSAKDVPGVGLALELGVDAVILSHEDEEMWEIAETIRQQRSLSSDINTNTTIAQIQSTEAEYQIKEAAVTDIASVGMGDRVCIDFIQLLQPGDGIWVGSCARSLALIYGEISENEFVPSRPFRVNAGAVHSYVVVQGGKMKYLCELKAGDKVQVINIQTGINRDVIIGRVKIEPRPLMKVTFKINADIGHVFLQQAETVKVICAVATEEKDPRWHPVAITALNVLVDKLFVRIQSRGTHVGKAIDTSVVEK